MNAKQLIEAFNHGLNLIDPVRIIPRQKRNCQRLVLRKSKLEYLKQRLLGSWYWKHRWFR
jgi:hypothetical protein